MSIRAGSLLLALALGACRTAAVGQAPASGAVTPLFGPVIGAEVIAGRAEDDEVVLLAGGVDLLRIDVAGRSWRRAQLGIAAGESCWSLARLADGSLWTLKGRRTLARIGGDSRIAEEVTLPAPHFGVFAADDRLIFQEAVFTAPGPALLAGSPGGGTRVPWSGIVTRRFDRLARASAAVLNMVSCGASATRERPCWFPDEAAVFLVTSEGVTRRVMLRGLEVPAPETLLTTDNPPRPVRDAVVDAHGGLWILSSGSTPAAAVEAPGGWLLAHYDKEGDPKGTLRLEEAARQILQVDDRRLVLLLSSGYVGEVTRW